MIVVKGVARLGKRPRDNRAPGAPGSPLFPTPAPSCLPLRSASGRSASRAKRNSLEARSNPLDTRPADHGVCGSGRFGPVQIRSVIKPDIAMRLEEPVERKPMECDLICTT